MEKYFYIISNVVSFGNDKCSDKEDYEKIYIM